MENTQKTFTIKLHTTNTQIDKEVIKEFIESSIEKSELSEDLTYTVDEHVGILFNFLNDLMAFSFFIRKTKEEFLEEYPYFAEEYDFCLSEFNKNPQEVLLDFLENTSTKELTEPYGLTPEDFSFSVGEYIKNKMTLQEKTEFLKKVVQKGLKVEIYDKVQIKALLSEGDDIYVVSGKEKDREGNVVFELEDEDGFLLDDLYYPSQLLKVEDED